MSNWLLWLFESFISFLIFCLFIPSITERRVLKSPGMIVNLSVSPFNSVGFNLRYFKSLLDTDIYARTSSLLVLCHVPL